MPYIGESKRNIIEFGQLTFSDTGDGSTVDFVLPEAPVADGSIDVWVGNVFQSTDVYETIGTTLRFSEGPAEGASVFVRFRGKATDTDDIPAGSITEDKFKGDVSLAKLASGTADTLLKIDGGVATEVPVSELTDPQDRININQNSFDIASNSGVSRYSMTDGFSDSLDSPDGVDTDNSLSFEWESSYVIPQSALFDGASYLSRTVSVAGNRRTWTFSAWVKRAGVGTNTGVFGTGNAGAVNAVLLDINTDDILVQGLNSSVEVLKLDSVAEFRDPSTWYHIMVVLDTTQVISSNRCKVFVDGEQVTNFDTQTYPALNTELQLLTGSETFEVGSYNTGTRRFFNGYITGATFIDGQALPPTRFGKFDGKGRWVPIEYTGTYGTNGFLLDFADSANLGTDVSGKSNTFTVTGLVAADQLNDSPSDDLQNDIGNFPILSSIWYPATDSQPSYAQPARMTVKNGGLECGPGGGSAIATLAAVSGMKIYFEARCIGSVSASAPGLALGVGKMNSVAHNTGLETRLRDGHWIYLGDGNKINESGTKSAYVGAAIARDAWVGFALDLSNGAVWARNTTGYFNSATEAEVEAGTTTNAMATGLDLDGLWTPVGNSFTNAGEFEFNFGQHDFQFSVPSGFTTLATQNFSEPSIADPELQMDVVLDTGANIKAASEALYTCQFAWIKDRDNTNNHQLIDTVRGTSNVLQSSTTAAETTYSAPAGNSVAWVWKAGDQIVENTDGTITSSVSANTTAGFSVGTYTGIRPTTGTVGHGLPAKPAMIIFKNRIDATTWYVWHKDLTNETTYALYLNTNAAQANVGTSTFNNTAPTSTVFSLGNDSNVNDLSDSHVFYAWSEVEGFSKFGSVKGNGSADGSFVYCGFRPRYILYKQALPGAGSWELWDTARDTYNPVSQHLNADNVNTEQPAAYLDIVSNGFKFRAALIGTATYIYAAFAENPLKVGGKHFSNKPKQSHGR